MPLIVNFDRMDRRVFYASLRIMDIENLLTLPVPLNDMYRLDPAHLFNPACDVQNRRTLDHHPSGPAFQEGKQGGNIRRTIRK